MDGDEGGAAIGRGQRLAPFTADRHDLAEQGTCRRCAQGHRHRGMDQQAFLLDPPSARLKLPGIGRAVDTGPCRAVSNMKCLTALVTYAVARIDPRFRHGAVEDLTAGPTKGWPARSPQVAVLSPTNISRAASTGPSPNTVWVAGAWSGQRCRSSPRRAARPRPPAHCRRARFAHPSWPSRSYPSPRPARLAINSETNAVSGMFFQYLRGISFSIARSSRRRLKMLA